MTAYADSSVLVSLFHADTLSPKVWRWFERADPVCHYSAQWHTNTRTGKSAVLRKLYPETCSVEIHPDDARRLRIAPNPRVTVGSRRAEITATAFVTPTVRPGQVFIPMHYDAVNRLTFASFDPHSRQPSYKHCAVRLTPA